jgi:hypothetical protein
MAGKSGAKESWGKAPSSFFRSLSFFPPGSITYRLRFFVPASEAFDLPAPIIATAAFLPSSVIGRAESQPVQESTEPGFFTAYSCTPEKFNTSMESKKPARAGFLSSGLKVTDRVNGYRVPPLSQRWHLAHGYPLRRNRRLVRSGNRAPRLRRRRACSWAG